MAERVNVYVDAFNLYYGALRRTPYRWLDLGKLCSLLLPRDEIHRIRYFTARVRPLPHNPEQPIRQQVYLRAIMTIPNLSIHYGHYLTHTVRMPLASSMAKAEATKFPPQFVEVVKAEEKGSDVNLATYLIHDGHLGDYTTAVIVSNDSDLLEPIRIGRNELGKSVGILNPYAQHPSKVLVREATFVKHIRPNVLRLSQFPNIMSDQHGTFHKPTAW